MSASATLASAASVRAIAALRISPSCAAVRSYTAVPNSDCSTSRRCSPVDRRNSANSPWGSTTVCTNWARVRPTIRATSVPTSWVLVPITSPASASGDDSRTSVAAAFWFVVPVPRALGRWCCGLRRTRWIPAAVSNTSSTYGSTPGAAWWLCSRSRLEPSLASDP